MSRSQAPERGSDESCEVVAAPRTPVRPTFRDDVNLKRLHDETGLEWRLEERRTVRTSPQDRVYSGKNPFRECKTSVGPDTPGSWRIDNVRRSLFS